jgi:hypothetical protein
MRELKAAYTKNLLALPQSLCEKTLTTTSPEISSPDFLGGQDHDITAVYAYAI